MVTKSSSVEKKTIIAPGRAALLPSWVSLVPLFHCWHGKCQRTFWHILTRSFPVAQDCGLMMAKQTRRMQDDPKNAPADPEPSFSESQTNADDNASTGDIVIKAEDLFQGRRKISIEFNGVRYWLKMTRRKKLILQK
jgi:hemin uptake protein HemP